MSSHRIALIEPYDGGSHRRFRMDWEAASSHTFTNFSQPPRKWKWRMRTAALHLQDQLAAIAPNDVIVTSGFLNLPEFKGLTAARSRRDAAAARALGLPIILFMHENQLTYPVQVEDERDYHYAFTNIVSCLTADAIWFNSAFHRDEFLGAIPEYLKRMPEKLSMDPVAAIAAKSSVMHLGVRSPLEALAAENASAPPAPDANNRPLRIGWNHRWEFDKNPEEFFKALHGLQDRGHPFELVMLGEHFRQAPGIFATERDRFTDQIIHWGFASDHKEYARLLKSCDVVISTAIHEFFGVSVVEAALAGCALLLPRRLSYPELFPAEYRVTPAGAFYDDLSDLVDRLGAWAVNREGARSTGKRLQTEAQRFLWSHRGPAFDGAVTRVVQEARN